MLNLPKATVLGMLELVDIFEFYDVPRLFTAKSKTGALYLVVSVFDDGDEFEWLYIDISIDRINSLINKSICLYTAFTEPENGFLYKVNTDYFGNANVEYVFPEQLESDDLPLPNTFLSVDDVKSYGLGEINPKRASEASRRETCNIHLYPWDTKLPELNTRSLGNILISTQELIDSLGQACIEEPTIKGAISAEILNKTRLNACQIFPGSFGLQLKSESISDLFGDSLLSDAFKEFMNLLSAEDNEDNISNKLHLLKGRVASKYRRFLKEIHNIGSGITVDWGSPSSKDGGKIFLSKQQIEKAYSIVDSIDIQMSEAIDVKATLIGLNIRTKRYEILSIKDNEKFSGRVSDDAIEDVQHAVIKKNYVATLKKVIEIKSSSGEESVKWILVGLKSS